MRLCLLDCRLSGSSRYGRMPISDATLVTGPVKSIAVAPRPDVAASRRCVRVSAGEWNRLWASCERLNSLLGGFDQRPLERRPHRDVCTVRIRHPHQVRCDGGQRG